MQAKLYFPSKIKRKYSLGYLICLRYVRIIGFHGSIQLRYIRIRSYFIQTKECRHLELVGTYILYAIIIIYIIMVKVLYTFILIYIYF